MARIALVSAPDAGHVLPVLGLAAALRRRGHTLRVVSGDGHDATAAAHGLVVERLPLLPPTPDDDDLGYRIWNRAATTAAPLAASLGDWRPDLVVADTLTRSGGFAAQLLGVPWVELIPHHLDDPAEDLPPIGLGRRPARSALRRAGDRRLVRLQRRSMARGRSQAEQAASGIGLPGVAPPVLRLVATLPSLERPRRAWPADAHVVGPLAIDPVLEPLTVPAGDLPLVVVTDSTAGGVGRSLGAVAVRALARMDLRVVVTSAAMTARCSPTMTIGTGPHEPLLAEASLAVGFGGAGFVSKALAAGVPLVVVPLQGDQREGAARLRDVGVARVVPGRPLGSARLRWTVVRQLADRGAAAAATRLAEEAGRLGPSVAVGLVEAFLRGALPVATGAGQHLPRHRIPRGAG